MSPNYLVLVYENGRELGVNRDGSRHSSEKAELLNHDEAKQLAESLRESGVEAFVVNEDRIWPSADDFDD